jgi:hypothetical protein
MIMWNTDKLEAHTQETALCGSRFDGFDRGDTGNQPQNQTLWDTLPNQFTSANISDTLPNGITEGLPMVKDPAGIAVKLSGYFTECELRALLADIEFLNEKTHEC